jgi:hypothetical protein
MMQRAGLSLVLTVCAAIAASADVTIVQKVEGVGPVAEMTIKIKGDKARIDATPQMTSIVDGKSGEMINLMRDQKVAVRISAEKMKAAAEMVSKFDDNSKNAVAPKLQATGKKEVLNGFETEQYIYETPSFKAIYWIAPKYPEAASLLRQLQSLNSDAWAAGGTKMPDYRDFPGLPLKTEISMGNSDKVTSTVTSIKQQPLNEAEFAIPTDYKEMKSPDIEAMLGKEAAQPPTTPTKAPPKEP